jgi:heme exporter protein A
MSPGFKIDFQNVEKRFGMRLALRGITLSIAPGEFVALVGANGSGKTTLLRIAALLSRPSGGTIRIDGEATNSLQSIRARCGLVSHATLLYDELTAGENLLFFARLYDLPNARATCTSVLERVGLSPRAQDLVRTFSRGMRQRLSLARALLAAPRLLLLDEPATGLDPAGQSWLAKEVARLHAEGCTILMSTHGNNEAHSAVTRAIRLESGAIAEDSGEDGDVSAILKSSGKEN